MEASNSQDQLWFAPIYLRSHSSAWRLSPSIRLSRSASAVARNSVRPVGVALPLSNAAVLVLDQVLVRERSSGGKVDSRGPHRVGASVSSGAESDGGVRVPATQLRDAAYDVHGLPEGGCAALVKGDASVGRCGAALAWSRWGRGAAGPGCVGRGGTGAGC